MTRKHFEFEYEPGATPLDLNEIEGLLVDYISTQNELNQLEQENILEAKVWVNNKKNKNLLTESFVRQLHKKMFENVWKWAGKYRHTDKSIGVPWEQITTEIANLLADTEYWINNKTYVWDELGTRFHHRLVKIHPFPNGNGRHARLMTDVLMNAHAQQVFTWGAVLAKNPQLEKAGIARSEYIAALREADQKNYKRLISFVRS